MEKLGTGDKMLLVVIILLLVISVASFFFVQLNEGGNKKGVRYRKFFIMATSVTLVIAVVLIMLQGYEKVISPNIIAYNKDKGIQDEYERPLILISKNIVPTVLAAESPDGNTTILEVKEDSVFEDESNNIFNSYDLIGRTICTYYTGDSGEVCIFLGRYDDNYNWDGNCSICAYKDGHLFYMTEDVYEHGRILSYRRISKSTSNNNRWVITEKKPMENGLSIGDTRSYNYCIIDSKINDIDVYNGTSSYMAKPSDMYTVDELYEKLSPDLIKHYNGMYDSDGRWEDTTGNAYSIEYENGRITTIVKGVFNDSSFLSGHQYVLKEDRTVVHTYGRFRNTPNGEVLDDLNWDKEDLSMEQFLFMIKEDKFCEEVYANIGG